MLLELSFEDEDLKVHEEAAKRFVFWIEKCRKCLEPCFGTFSFRTEGVDLLGPLSVKRRFGVLNLEIPNLSNMY